MSKKPILMILGIFILFSMFSMISAQPPFQQSIALEGLEIEYPKFEYLEIGQAFEVNSHVFNKSNGVFIDNSTTRCFFHGYYRNGTHLVKTEMNFEPPFDWYLDIPAEVFTGGKGSWIIQCNSTEAGGLGGFASGPVTITPTGFEFTVSEAILYGFVLLLIGMFLFFAISGIRKAESGTWLIFYICLTYIILYALMGIVYLLASNYLWVVPIIGNILYIVWLIMGYGFLPFVIVLSLYILGQEARAALEQNYMDQGYTRDEARELSRKNKR